MGQRQLLIIAISVLIIGIAILAAVGYFRTGDVDANKKAMINDINQIAHLSVLYYSRPLALQGGNHSFVGFVIPDKFQSNLNGSYDATPIGASLLSITGKSKRDSSNTVTAQIDKDGKASSWTFTGDFR